MKPVRVGVWDPSPTIRSLLRRVLSRVDVVQVEMLDGVRDIPGRGAAGSLDIVVVGFGVEGIDATTMAFVEGRVDGPRFILLTPPGHLHRRRAPRLMTRPGVAVLPKPSTEAGWEGLGTQLEELLQDLVASESGVGPREISERWASGQPAELRRAFRLAVAGGSSGGPAALHSMLRSIDRETLPGLAVVQHIAPGFEVELTRWLARDLDMDVAVAGDGERLLPGRVRIAPAGAHLRLADGERLLLDRRTPPRNGHRPSVDELFLSVEARMLPVTVAILLDGMGRDGVEGLRRVRDGGGVTIVQDPRTCVVGGMPLTAIQEEAALHVLPPEAIGRFLSGRAGKRGER